MDINDTPQTLANQRDLAIKVQLEKISTNAMKDVKYRGPLKIKSAVTNEMIEKYQDELQNSFYTDEQGIKRRYYAPASIDVQLEAPDPNSLQAVLTPEQIADKYADMKLYASEIAKLEASLDVPEIELDLVPVTGFMAERNVARAENAQRRRIYQQLVQQREAYIQRLKKEIQDNKDEYDALANEIRSNDSKMSENRAYIDTVDKVNRDMLKIQSDELNRLNRGRLNLEQQPNEDPVQFRKRMLEVGAATFDEDLIEQQAELRLFKQLKQKMKDIVRDEIFIDSFLKRITPNQDYDKAYLYDTRWKQLNSAFERTFGTWNDRITEQALEDFFDSVIKEPTVDESVQEEEFIVPEVVRALSKEELKDNYYKTYSQWYKKLTKQDRQNFPSPSIAFQKKKISLIKDLMKADLIRMDGDGLRKVDKPSKQDVVGKIKVNPKLLYYDNVLVLKHLNGSNIHGFRNQKVSEPFVQIVMKLLKKEDPSIKDINELSLDEKTLFDHFLYLAGLHKQIGNGLKDTRQAMKNRLELLEGQLEAGNTNPMILDELKNLLFKMAQHKMITMTDAVQHFKSYNL